MNILIINGAEVRNNRALGDLNSTLTTMYLDHFRNQHQVMITDVFGGYTVQEERNKFLNADLVILQFPVYWFSIPGLMKRYIDDVFDSSQFFAGQKGYGRNGKLKGKYILSATWNALEDQFETETGFFDGLSVDQVFTPVHKAFQYIGLIHAGTLSLHDVIKNPNIDQYTKQFTDFITQLDLK